MSVAVHTAVPTTGEVVAKPGAKLFDLVSPGEYAAGHVFFEAPPGTHLPPDTSYVMVWRYVRGTTHRLQRTLSSGEDSGAATGSSIAGAFNLGADLDSLSQDANSNSLEIAVYTETNTKSPFATDDTEPETEGPFVPYTFGDGYKVTCSAPPAEHCPTYDTVAGADRVHLSTTMTVGRAQVIRSLGTITVTGFFSRHGHSCVKGIHLSWNNVLDQHPRQGTDCHRFIHTRLPQPHDIPGIPKHIPPGARTGARWTEIPPQRGLPRRRPFQEHHRVHMG